MGAVIPPLPQYAFMELCSVKIKALGQLYLLPVITIYLKLSVLCRYLEHEEILLIPD